MVLNKYYSLGVLLALFALVGIMVSNLPHRQKQLIYLTQQEQKDRAFIVAIHEQATEKALALLKAGANPNARGYWDARGRWDDVVRQRVWEPRRNTDGPTALMLSAFAGDIKVAKALLERGADVEALDGIHSSALFCATSYGRVDIAKLLLDHGASVHANDEGDTPLIYALGLHDTELVRRLFQRGLPVNRRDKRGDMPLHVVASLADVSMIRLLLSLGADLNARDTYGNTPLHLAVSHQNSGHGIHISPEAQRQSTLLLLKNKADRSIKNQQNYTALQIAQDNHRTDLVNLFKSGL